METSETEFWKLVEENRAPLWRFSLGLTRSHDEAADLMSDAVVSAHTSFPKLQDRSKFRSSLFTIALRIFKRRRWRARIFGTLEEAEHHADTQQRESQHDLDELKRALAALPEKQLEAVLLFEISGLSLEEIREIQGGSVSGVKSRLVRGREALRAILTKEASPLIHTRKIPLPQHRYETTGQLSKI